ncbi:MAG TPA: selenocysteine-specific translation elongation factor [Bacillota bacterium]|jgi:selenocysteine-specific elongation factor|nr:selenocysteine-specific translation elongation factor [Bacillota bacterium]HPZ22111.1 selenocysteine-specific translation elongation factor [Bacillota bacterium]HQD20031.1 selenocysteine-specific translation elongation factor [Bacillota bacterium]
MDNNLIIGTAGHVDHGKSALIRALTGIETDRLQQEKQRGITIELGFAWFDLPDGRRAGIIDVPGHERFVKNMLAGAAGIDVVLLVVAADEGVMPQTMEHLAILQLLGVQRGIVVITKIDLVDDEMLELAEMTIDEALEGTFLQDAPRVRVSAVSGEGLEELRQVLADIVTAAPSRPRRSFSRLPVDRVFVLKGFGTVITGTLLDGSIKEGDQVLLMPGEISARVRQLQIHGNHVPEAHPGQRVAVNLAGVERQGIHRGQVLFKGEGLEPVDKVAGRFYLLPSAPVLTSNTRIRFHCGSSETIGRAVILGADQVEPGKDALVQFRLEEPVVAVRGDRYVIRSWSPVTTIGGGEIIETGRQRLSRHKREVVDNLLLREEGDPPALVLSYLDEAVRPLSRRQLLLKAQLAPEELEQALKELGGAVITFQADGEEWLFSKGEQLLAQLRDLLAKWHQDNPLRQGMPREEVRTRLLPNVGSRGFASLLEKLLPGSGIKEQDRELALETHEVSLSPEQLALQEKLLQVLRENLFSPPQGEELEALGPVAPLLKLLAQQGSIVIAGGMVFAREAIEAGGAFLRKHFEQEPQLTLAQFRDFIGSSRKYALPLLEYFDGAGFTRRRGDVRIAGPNLRGVEL